MRIAFTSDLHVDHHPEVVGLIAERVRELSADVLVIAGDVSSSTEHLRETLAGLRPSARRCVFVPGNHDLWSRPDGPSSRALYEDVLPSCARSAGFEPLGSAPVEIDGLWFAGVTGWFDYSLRNRSLDDAISLADYRSGSFGRLRWNDTVRVRWPDDAGVELEAPAICDGQRRSLEAQLQRTAGAPTVVVTHHLPFRELVTSLGELPWEFLNGFMGSEALGRAILEAPGVRLCISGHTHFRKQAVLDGASGPVRAEVSPIGYPREYKRAGLELPARVRDRVGLVEL